MIHLTRLDRSTLYLNPDLIEHMESTPDTVVAMTNGQRFMVREGAEEVVQKVVEFRRRVLLGPRGVPEVAGRRDHDPAPGE